MRVLISGIVGFIGSTLADRLIRDSHTVYGIDNFETGLLINLNNGVKFTEDNISKLNACETIFGGNSIDVVIHCAASYKDPNNYAKDVDTNAKGTAYIVQMAKKYKAKRIIYLQTSLCYGHPKTNPITLDHPINPPNSYAISKTAGEQYIKMSGIDYVSLRLANCYGPRNLSGPIPVFYKNITTGKKSIVVDTRRDFVFVDDLIDVIIKAINGIGHGEYHVSSGTDISIIKLYETVRTILGLTDSVERRKRGDDDVESILLDPDRTLLDFGILPSVSLEEGITKAIEWYKSNGVDNTYTHLRIEDKDES